MDKFAEANIAIFLMSKTGLCCGTWSGNLTASQQNEMFGVFLGEGRIVLNGATEIVQHVVKTASGVDVYFESKFDKIDELLARIKQWKIDGK